MELNSYLVMLIAIVWCVGVIWFGYRVMFVKDSPEEKAFIRADEWIQWWWTEWAQKPVNFFLIAMTIFLFVMAYVV